MKKLITDLLGLDLVFSLVVGNTWGDVQSNVAEPVTY